MKNKAFPYSVVALLALLLFSPYALSSKLLIDSTKSGLIASSEQADIYHFSGVAGEAVKIEVESTGQGLDPALTLFLQSHGLPVGLARHASALSSGIQNDRGSLPATQSFRQALSTESVFVEIVTPADGTVVPIPTDPANVTVSGNAGISGTSTPTNLEIAIVFDVSGSVDSAEYDLEVAGIRQVLNALDPNNTGLLSTPVALVQFDSTATVTSPLTRSRSQLEAGLVRLRSGGTSFDPALTAALSALAPSSPTDGTTEVVLFFSDGAGSLTNSGGGGPLDTMVANNIVISSFGIGGGVSETTLIHMAQTTAGSYTAIPTFQEVPLVTASLPGVVGLASVTLDTDGDGIGDINANVGVDGSWQASVPISVGTNTLTAIATATDPLLPQATDTITVIGVLRTIIGNQIQVLHDDDSGAGNNALVEVFRLPATGEYSLIVTSSAKNGGGTTGNYLLKLTPVDINSNVMSVGRGTVPHLFSTLDGRLRRAFGDAFIGFAANGRSYAVLRGGVPHIFNTQDGRLIRAFGDKFTSYSPAGDTYVVERGTVPHLFRTVDGRLLRAFGDEFIGYGPYGKYLALLRGTVPHIFNTASGALIRAFGDDFITFSPKGRYYAVGRGTVPHIFRTQDGRLMKVFGDQFVAFAPDGESFVVLRGGVPHLFRSADGRLMRAFGDSFAAYAPDGKSYVVLRGGVPHLFRTSDGALLRAFGDTFVSYSPHGQAYTVLRGTVPHQFSALTGRLVRAFGDAFAAYSPDGESFVVTRGGVPHLFRTVDGRLMRAFGDTFVGFSPTAETYVVLRGTVPHLFRVSDGRLLRAFGDAFAAFSPNGETYVVTRGGVPHLFRTSDGRLLRAFGDSFVGYSPRGDSYVILRGTVPHLFSTADGRLIRAFGDAFLGYNPTGTSMVVSRGTVPHLFRTSDGRLMRAFGDAFAAFSLDGMTYVVLRGGVPHLFNTFTGRLIRAFGDVFLGYSFDRTPDMVSCTPNTNIIVDGGFEAGVPNPNWTETSTNFSTPLCTVATCGDAGGTSGPYAGTVWAWFGGFSGGQEDGSVSQQVSIPAGAAELKFQLQVPFCDSAADFLEIKVDSSSVYRVDGASTKCGGTAYAEQTVDLSSFADNGNHTLQISSSTFSSSGGASSFMVDDVVLNACAP